MEFPQLTMSLPDGREESIMQRTCLVSRATQLSVLHILVLRLQSNMLVGWLGFDQALRAGTMQGWSSVQRVDCNLLITISAEMTLTRWLGWVTSQLWPAGGQHLQHACGCP